MEELRKNNPAEKLQQELTLRGKYYFKGFGSYLQGFMAGLDNLARYGKTPEREERIRKQLAEIIALYQSIPFEQIANHPDYYLLLQIKEEISKLAPTIENVLTDGKNIDESIEIIRTIHEKGMEYRKRIEMLLKQLNLQPGHEKDGFKVTDIHGQVWNNGI